MSTEEQVRESLGEVILPQVGRSLGELNMVRGVEITGSKVKVTLASTALNPSITDWVQAMVRSAIEELPEVKEVVVEFVEALPKDLNHVRHTIAVMSGKGGVGKSLIASLLAIA